MSLFVIGATGRTGRILCHSLAEDGVAFTPVLRSRAKWRRLGLPGRAEVADLERPHTLHRALKGASIVVSCAHARHTPAILDAAPDGVRHFVLMGSTRKFTRWPDDHARGVLEGEAAFRQSSRRGVMLHPTMIYGAQGEDNVRRLARLLRRLPAVPLPGGGASIIRPIHQDDVTRALRAAIAAEWHRPEAMVIAGADRISYAEFVRAVAFADGQKPPRIVTVSSRLLGAVAPLTRLVPFFPTIRAAEIRRLEEDKTFGIEAMRRTLGVEPIGLEEGLRRTFGHPEPPPGTRRAA